MYAPDTSFDEDLDIQSLGCRSGCLKASTARIYEPTSVYHTRFVRTNMAKSILHQLLCPGP